MFGDASIHSEKGGIQHESSMAMLQQCQATWDTQHVCYEHFISGLFGADFVLDILRLDILQGRPFGPKGHL